MGNTLEQVASTLNEFTAELLTSAGPSSEFTMSAEQLNESIFGDQTPTEDTQ
jgi:hypothetical protein